MNAPTEPNYEAAFYEVNKILSEIEEFCVTTLQDWPSKRSQPWSRFRSDLEMVLDCINREGEWSS